MTILDVVDMGFKVLCVVEIGLIAWGWRVWREVITMEKKYPTVENEYGVAIDFEEAVNLMDDDIRESLNAELAPCSP